MKSFNVPIHYRSKLVSAIKNKRKADDRLKKDFKPTRIKLETIEIILARHFGFCYGVENAIEIAFRAIEENPDKRIFLLSEIIHNPKVNADLIRKGVKFIMDTSGKMLMDWNEITKDDIVIIPAFGTTLEMQKQLRQKSIETASYETTCPFVEKVWNRAERIGKDGYSIIVHGKPNHEETKATFSHSNVNTPTVVVKDMEEAEALACYIRGEKTQAQFLEEFKGQHSATFDVTKDLNRIGVVNQTTMLASETQSIAEFLKQTILKHHNVSPEDTAKYVAETRDTLCYATNDNQSAVNGMLEEDADFALVIGGYNSSNTSHLVELCENKLPTYYIKDETCLIDKNQITHFDWRNKIEKLSTNYFPQSSRPKIMITSGASCPDALVERVIAKVATLCSSTLDIDNIVAEFSE